jgi:hypothetical protein
MRNVIGVLFFFVCFVVVVIGCIKLTNDLWTNQEYNIGPHSLHTLYADDVFFSDKPLVVSLKSDCNFVLVGLDTKETITASRILPALGEESDKYVMTNMTINGRYQLALCTADIYSENSTTITVDTGLEDKILFTFTYVLSATLLSIVIYVLASKIVD